MVLWVLITHQQYPNHGHGFVRGSQHEHFVTTATLECTFEWSVLSWTGCLETFQAMSAADRN